ncbi:CHC2 zinc finger domain-containing protein [Kitasatospora sp. NPDC048194]|uniref:CHC2 zinc finger domain-containing protein n=1 Tax=Kitasatospora sp. NPDC048194 TaxID=3364045 RepID=UPI0037120846
MDAPVRFAPIDRHDRDDADEQKPTLEAAFDHYGVEYNPQRSIGMAPCPLHEDGTPSLSYNTDRQVWKCHSCGQGGDSYSLIMMKESTDFVGARALAASVALATRDAGGGDGLLSGSAYGGRRALPGRSRDRAGRAGYVPAWRRR